MRGTRRLGALVASALIAGTWLGALAPAAGAAAPAIERVTAPDPVSLAAAVSSRTFPAKTPVAYVATAAGYADALAAGATAGGSAPILLVDPAGLSASTATELARLAPTRVVILGGTAAVPPSVADDVAVRVPNAVITRVAGIDRYDTAATLSRSTFTTASTAFLATGAGFADALAAGPAANGTAPILLTTHDAVPSVTLDELQRLGVKRIVVLGGAAAVGDDVLTSLKATILSATVTRVAGADRYATAASLARTIAPTSTGAVVVASGSGWQAALVAAPAAARAHAPLLLADGAPGKAVTGELGRRGADHLLVVGDLDDDTVAGIVSAAVPPVPAPLDGASAAVDMARSQLGRPYLWGGAGPDAYDCSGLTMVAWAAGDVTLPHSSEAQAYAVETVPFTQLQPGDLLFYGAPIHHVGIYVGDGSMVEAARAGVPVRTASIWRTDLIAAGRPTTTSP